MPRAAAPYGSQGRARLEDACVVLVDQDNSRLEYIAGMLRNSGFSRCSIAREWRDIEQRPEAGEADLVLVDVDTEGGTRLLSQVCSATPAGVVRPVVALTEDKTPTNRKRLLGLGATDYLLKPFEIDELVMRVRSLLSLRANQIATQGRSRQLEDAVRERTGEVVRAQMETIERLAAAGEYRDDETGLHAKRVGELAAALAEVLGEPQNIISLLRRAAPLHDIGKIGVPDSVLLKPGLLTEEEFELMKTHTLIGAKILGGSSHELIRYAAVIALTHHERYDGLGYPAGLEGEFIPLSGRIVAVADAFDALTHQRRYKRAWPLEAAVGEIRKGTGTRYDPKVVEALLNLHRQGRLQQFL